MTIPIITARTNPALHYLIEPGALLADLGFREEIDLIGLQCSVEEALGIELPDYTHAAWLTVGDVLALTGGGVACSVAT